MPLFHFDMYRIESEDDLDSIDFDGYFDRGMILTEWTENILERLPERYISVHIAKISDDKREIIVKLEENADADTRN